MSTITKRILAFVLCFVMLTGMLPVSALAEDTVEETTVASEATEAAETTAASSEPTETGATEESFESTETTAPAAPSDPTETTAATGETTEPTETSTEPEVIAVAGITLDRTSLEVGVGAEPVTLTVTVAPEDATDKTVIWTSSEPGVASVADGVVTFGYMGEAVITATAGDFSATCAVTVGEGETAAYAENVLDAAIFCSDVHGSTSDLTSTMEGVATSGLTYSSIGFVGDTCLTVAKTESAVNSGLGYTPTVMFSYASSHDTENSADISTNWNYSGEVEGVSDYYLVYTIRETDMQNSSDAASAAPAFTTWYEGLTAAEKALPIFIMSHRPLHARRSDNAGAAAWYEVISAAAETSDIVFFWAHNHTGETSVDTAAYYVAKDGSETFTVYNGDTVVPNFTYMNAGYINANNQSPKRIGVATTVQITADELIFQDYNASGEYTDSSYSHNAAVEREFAYSTPEAPTLESIAISGTTEYYVGDELALTVTATYSDGSIADVTTDATLSGYDMSAAGTYTVTAAYGEKTATTEITVSLKVNTITEWDDTNLISVQAAALGLTGMTVTNVYGEPDLSATFSDYMSVDVALEGVAEGEEIAYSMLVLDEIPTDGLVLYHVAEDGTLTPISYQLTTSESGGSYLNFTTTLTGTFAYGIVAVPEGYVLSSIAVTNVIKTDYFVNDDLDMVNPVVTATYTKEGAEDFTRILNIKDNYATTDGYTVSGFDMTIAGAQTVTITYETCTTSFNISVWGEEFTASDVTVHVGDADYGVTAANVAVVENETVAEYVADVIKGENYVAYDITLTLSENYTLTNGEKTVTLPIPEGVTTPVVYYVSDDGATVTNMNAADNGDGTVTFTTTHFSTYVIGESTEITVPENQTATGTGTTTTTTDKTVYVLVSTPTAGNQYIIVSSGSADSGYALKENTTTGTSVTINAASGSITAPYIETSDETIMWNATSGLNFQSENGGYYLNYSSSSSGGNRPGQSSGYSLSFSTNSASDWAAGTNMLYRNGQNNDYYLRCNGSTWAIGSSNTTYNVYFYEKQTVKVETTTTVSGTYTIEGEDLSAAVSENSTANLTSTLTFTPDSGTATTTNTSTTASYKIVTVDANGNTVNGDPNNIISKIENGEVTFTGKYGTALVEVSFTTDFGVVTDYITVEATAPYYTIQLHKAELVEAEGVTAENFTAGTYYTFDSVTNTYHVATAYVEGVTYYTTPVIPGDEITDTIALKGIEAGDTYSVWAIVKEHNSEYPDGEDMGALGDALSWSVSDPSIATIDATTGVITFTGKNYGTFQVTVSYKGDDGKVVTDTITISVTDTLYTVPGDGTDDFPEYPNEGAIRFDKTATAVGNFSETGLAKVELSMTGVPYTTGHELDVVLMLDITGSMHDKTSTTYTYSQYVRVEATIIAAKNFVKNIVVNEDGTYNDNRVGVYSFNSGGTYTLVDLGTISSDTELEAAYTAIEGFNDDYQSGGTPYDNALSAVQSTLTAAKTTNLPEDTETADDYSRQQFAVFMTDGVPTSYAYVNGDTYGTHSSASDIAGMLTSSDDYATRDTDYKYEYYSTEMKEDKVTVFSVGLGLENTNSAWSGTATQCLNLASVLLNDISGPAGETTQPDAVGTNTLSKKDSYFFSVDDADAATDMDNIFKNIAQKILEAATDVVVEDKIGNDYNVQFTLPGNVTSEETDGLSEFYIQAVEYQLNADKERTGDPTVLENFTFNADGTLKSHTVDGVACTDCSHVTITNGTVTAIDGTYFDYSNTTEDGEILTWNADKLTTTELALQYFAYLENSADAVGTDNEIPAGTYYTNEYATLTYTNYKGNRVQQEFPIPQMTWNGAQVSYVFYLVNEAGQPVNRAGRVVPFAEAVYVTDVYTYSVIWNDLEQSAGLEAKYLADDLVPDVYALYDDDASYNIHVYEDEDAVNLNNHFVIGGDVSDDYNTTTHSWTNAKTTYVFNNKSDATKYNTVGAYIANDGNDNSDSTTYLCKGSGTVTSTISEVAVADQDAFNDGVYFIRNEDGTYERPQLYSETATYYAITSASYTAADGETQKLASEMETTSGGTVIGNYVYYLDENGTVYTIVQKSDGAEVHTGFDFSNTTVAFAVVWTPKLAPDTVVVDYGLDVVIDVITNDNMAAGVVGVRTDVPSGVTADGTYDRDEAATLTSVDLYINANHDTEGLKEMKLATATVENMNAVRFSLDESTGMQFSAPAEFYYEADVNYYNTAGGLVTTSMYSSVTVIPATTIYYEDEFLTLTSYTKGTDGNFTLDETTRWAADGIAMNATQAQDRPGESKISEALDADNNYGYDAAYETMSTHSLDSAAKITVDENTRGEATFTFYGTGFDVIGLTSNATGTLTVQVYAGAEATGTAVKSTIVDTYYGMEEDGTLSVNNPNTLYQVPEIRIFGLDYAQYTVKITAGYNAIFDHNSAGSYDLYLDAIRIYDPTGNEDETALNAYIKDGEAYPVYEELRDNIIAASEYKVTENEDGTVTVTGNDLSGAIFIDCNDAVTKIADYVSYGPNNELYLANNQAVAFNVVMTETLEDVQLGIKVANGNTVTYEINGTSYTTNSTTDLYYSILEHAKDADGEATTVTIKNVSSGILSLTNIKVTYSAETSTNGLMRMTAESAGYALMSLRGVSTEEETTEPETTVPEETEPETTVPEGTEAETTVPEETEPETTVPEETESEQVVNAIVNAVTTIVNTIRNIFSKWFR